MIRIQGFVIKTESVSPFPQQFGNSLRAAESITGSLNPLESHSDPQVKCEKPF